MREPSTKPSYKRYFFLVELQPEAAGEPGGRLDGGWRPRPRRQGHLRGVRAHVRGRVRRQLCSERVQEGAQIKIYQIRKEKDRIAKIRSNQIPQEGKNSAIVLYLGRLEPSIYLRGKNVPGRLSNYFFKMKILYRVSKYVIV